MSFWRDSTKRGDSGEDWLYRHRGSSGAAHAGATSEAFTVPGLNHLGVML